MKIYAPNEHFTGEVAGVGFAHGVGEVDKSETGKIDYFRRKGYGVGSKAKADAAPVTESMKPVTPSEPIDGTAGTGDADALETRTVKELTALARQQGIESPPRKKEDLVAALKALEDRG